MFINLIRMLNIAAVDEKQLPRQEFSEVKNIFLRAGKNFSIGKVNCEKERQLGQLMPRGNPP